MAHLWGGMAITPLIFRTLNGYTLGVREAAAAMTEAAHIGEPLLTSGVSGLGLMAA